MTGLPPLLLLDASQGREQQASSKKPCYRQASSTPLTRRLCPACLLAAYGVCYLMVMTLIIIIRWAARAS